jgi:hypothetical protein
VTAQPKSSSKCSDDKTPIQEVHQFCKGFMDRLRKLLKKNPPKESPCHSCAFAPSTDRWVGFQSTVWELIQAHTNSRPFYCHRNMPTVNGNYRPDPANMIRCANYDAIEHLSEEIDTAMREAAMESAPERGE